MDTGEGRFEMFFTKEEEEKLRKVHPKSKGVFSIGEQLKIKGSLFRVIDISPFGIKLKLLPAEQKHLKRELEEKPVENGETT